MRKTAWVICALIALIVACRKETGNPPANNSTDIPVLTPFIIRPPAHFPKLPIPEDNQPYVEKIQLGRILYYDPILSNDGRSCATCHVQSKGFTIDGMINDMPVLPHVNLAWNTNFMWDGSQRGTLEDLMLFEVKDFFGTDIAKVNASAKYRELFKKYFAVDNITYKEVSYALAQFVRTLISRDTKYDAYLQGYTSLSYDELQGRNIFFSEKGDCYHCHVNPVLTDNLLHNIGLDSLYTKEMDKGLYNVTHDNKDLGKFRTPNLRNVGLRKRYMHDGRFQTLEEVIEFYNSGVRKVTNLDPIMTKAGKENGLQLSELEKHQLVAFLQTFTDATFTSDTSLSNPE